LGLPLHFRNPRRIDYQAYIDKVASRLQTWKGKQLNRKGRLTLINSVLTSTLTYLLMVFDPVLGSSRKLIDYEETSYGRVMNMPWVLNAWSIGSKFAPQKMWVDLASRI
jgi:hypothetical protein